jgi:hypothetical protein
MEDIVAMIDAIADKRRARLTHDTLAKVAD